MGVRTHRLIAVVLVLSLLAACGGGGGDDDGKGDASSDDAATTTTVADGENVGDQADGDGTGGGAGAPGGSGGSSGGGVTVTGGAKPTPLPGSGGGSSPSTTGASSAPAPPRSGDEPTATPGRYTYNRTRDNSPTEGTLVVHAPQAADQRFVTTYPAGEASELVVRTRSGGIDLLLLKTTTPLLGTKEFRPSPPVLFAPDPATVGATWSWRMTSTDNSRTLDGTFKVVRNERLAIGGEQVDTVVVEATIQVSGDLTGTLHQTTWASPRYRLAVRVDERLESTFARYTQSATLTSTRPA